MGTCIIPLKRSHNKQVFCDCRFPDCFTHVLQVDGLLSSVCSDLAAHAMESTRKTTSLKVPSHQLKPYSKAARIKSKQTLTDSSKHTAVTIGNRSNLESVSGIS